MVLYNNVTEKDYLERGGPALVVFYNKLSWFVFELPKKDISNVVV